MTSSVPQKEPALLFENAEPQRLSDMPASHPVVQAIGAMASNAAATAVMAEANQTLAQAAQQAQIAAGLNQTAQTILSQEAAALAAVPQAAASAAAASSSASSAAGYAATMQASVAQFKTLYLGELAADPTVDGNGNALIAGAEYFNTVEQKLRVYSGTAWGDYDSSAQTASANATLAASQAAGSASAAAASASAAASSASAAATSASALVSYRAATIAAMLGLSALTLSNNQQINVANYATPYVTSVSDNGGGTFVWNSTSTATPDGGVTFAPTGNLTTVSGAALATGNGATKTFSGSLANGIVNPGSLTVTAGASTLTDDGQGHPLLNGLPAGTLNYTTGAWTLSFPSAPSGSITGTYQYVNSAGRWLRLFSGNVHALWFGLGAKTIAGSDATATIQAANNYAYANSLGLEISAPPGYTAIKTSYTVQFTTRYVNAMPSYGTDSSQRGINFNFSSASTADLYPAFIASGASGQRIRGIYVVMGTTNNLFTGSLATMASNGAINTTTLGDLSLYTTVAPYSAFAAGPVAFSLGGGSSQPVFENCGSRAGKFGLVLDSTNGHTESVDCQWSGGLAGVYVKTNSESYIFQNGGIGGQLCSVMLGDTLVAGHYGGISGLTTFQNIDFGFSPYAFLQVHDYTSAVASAGGVSGTVFINCGFDAVVEEAFRLLPYAAWAPQFVNCVGPSGAGTYSAANNLPAAFTMANGHATFWAWCGTIGQFKFDGFGSGVWGFSAVGGVLQGIMVAQAIVPGTVPLRPQEYALFGAGLVIVNSSGTAVSNGQLDVAHPNFLNSQSRLPEATKNVLMLPRDLAPQRNLLPNPENASNWHIQTTGNAVTVASYSTLAASLPPVNSMPPDMVQELGANPNVVQIAAGTATTANPYLNFIGNPTVVAHPTNVGIGFWVYVGTTNLVGVGIVIYTNSGFTTKLYQTTINLTSGAGWYKVLFYGQNAYQNSGSGADNYYRVTLSGSSLGAGNSIYVAGLMAFTDEVAPYNPYNGPTLSAPLGHAGYASASLPAAANFPVGAQTFCTNGRNTGEGAGAGTGCPVFVKSISGTNTWCAVWSGVAVTV